MNKKPRPNIEALMKAVAASVPPARPVTIQNTTVNSGDPALKELALAAAENARAIQAIAEAVGKTGGGVGIYIGGNT